MQPQYLHGGRHGQVPGRNSRVHGFPEVMPPQSPIQTKMDILPGSAIGPFYLGMEISEALVSR